MVERASRAATAVMAVLVMSMTASAQNTARPGDIYREYSCHTHGDDWRITDKEAVKKFGDRAKQHLPNPQLRFEIADLTDAVRAEVMLDRWGGHRGTVNKRIRFNQRGWIAVPELQDVPSDLRPEMLMFQDNPVLPVPLEDLVEGENFFQGDCDEAGGFGWGQWGVYGFTVRVYFKPGSKEEITGEITQPVSGAQLGENPNIRVNAAAANGVSRVDVVGFYRDYDFDGDGEYTEWQESHFQLVRGEPIRIASHVGTRWSQPYHFQWDTHWVPDQAAESIKMLARIQDSRGYWYVTDIVEDLTLIRKNVQVRLFPAQGISEDFGVRAGRTKSCWFEVPSVDAEAVTETALHFRSWHGWDGHHDPLQLNGHPLLIQGKNHHFDYDLLPLPARLLQPGRNELRFHSETEHHQLEVLWPGPALVVRVAQDDS